jgi:chemotaxis protein methyltransferase CheR
MTHALDAVAVLLRRETGIRIDRSQHSSLRAALARATPGGDAAGFLQAADDPVWGRETIARLVDAVTIKETYFLREPRQLDAIPWRLLLERAHRAGSSNVRVWSAACATGEEPYTLALLASEALGGTDPPVSILGTDISTVALEGALAGRYRERAVSAIEPALRRRYFDEDGDALIVGERLRRLVRFAPHNLAHDPLPPLGEAPFDLILCRNVLIYFDGATVERAIDGLEHALRTDGMLILGSADTLCGTVRRLEQIGAERGPLSRPRAIAARALRRPLGRGPGEPLAADALDAEASFLSGVRALDAGDPAAATVSLRRALYVDPAFGLAAFTLGRAHEAAGDEIAARRAYGQALRTIDAADERYDHLLEQVDLKDVAAACRVRLGALR